MSSPVDDATMKRVWHMMWELKRAQRLPKEIFCVQHNHIAGVSVGIVFEIYKISIFWVPRRLGHKLHLGWKSVSLRISNLYLAVVKVNLLHAINEVGTWAVRKGTGICISRTLSLHWSGHFGELHGQGGIRHRLKREEASTTGSINDHLTELVVVVPLPLRAVHVREVPLDLRAAPDVLAHVHVHPVAAVGPRGVVGVAEVVGGEGVRLKVTRHREIRLPDDHHSGLCGRVPLERSAEGSSAS
mmetsp:Transcript_11376/g.21584  ORF Transcript_11376/g.21584 Transcript_11376/m.21584 type:complete len:243 (-) Transcript_11376:136-864(-)